MLNTEEQNVLSTQLRVLTLVEQLGKSLAHYPAFPDSAITRLVESVAEE